MGIAFVQGSNCSATCFPATKLALHAAERRALPRFENGSPSVPAGGFLDEAPVAYRHALPLRLPVHEEGVALAIFPGKVCGNVVESWRPNRYQRVTVERTREFDGRKCIHNGQGWTRLPAPSGSRAA